MAYGIFLCVVAIATMLGVVIADLNSGCPQWGCLAWGSFSLSARVPQTANGGVSWSTTVEALNTSDVTEYERGCVSNQDFVVCTTQSGYVSLDPSDGKQLWNYTAMSPPFLPSLDIYGDAIGMSKQAMVYVSNDGTAKRPIGIKIMHPKYGLMISNNSKIFLTASLTKTAQVFTYDTDGIIDAAYELRGSWERMNGTYVPCSHPIIAGNRVYLVTRFVPETGDPKRTSQWLKLYAIDLLNQMAPRIWTAWNVSLEMEAEHMQEPLEESTLPDPIVTFFNNTIYINRQFSSPTGTESKTNGALYAFRDMGNYGKRIFKVDSNYGPMAVFDTFDKPIKDIAGTHVVWAAQEGGAVVTGHRSTDGSTVLTLDCERLANISVITSRLSVTRQAAGGGDVLVLGGRSVDGTASVIAVTVDPSDNNAKLMWKVLVSESKSDKQEWSVVGQVVNTAQPGGSRDQPVAYGVIAAVREAGPAGSYTHVKAIYEHS